MKFHFLIKKEGLHLQPAGNYVRAFYQDSGENAVLCYRKIFAWAKANGFRLHGYAYEIILNENVIDRAEDALVQIEIPVTPESEPHIRQ